MLELKEIYKDFVGPKPLFFLGNMLMFNTEPVEIFKTIMNLQKTYGKKFIVWGVGYDLAVSITDPNDLEIILSKNNSEKSNDYGFLIPWLGTGLLISRGKKWYKRRKIITPTFHFKILENFIDTFNKQGDIFIEKIQKYIDKGDVDIYNDVNLCTLDIICEAAMGVHINAQKNPTNEYVNSVKEISLLLFKRIFSVTKQWPWYYKLTPSYFQEKRLIKKLHKFTTNVIEAKIKKMELENKNQSDDLNLPYNDDEIFYGRKQKFTFLELLLHARIDDQPLSKEDIREEVDTFMFEGHDTTTSAISFLFYNLAENPDIQEQVFQELINVFGTDLNNPVTYNTLNELKYMDMVIKESLRIHPSVPQFGRETLEDIQLTNTILPAGTKLSITAIAMHNSPDLFPNPEKFDPERFSLENSEKRHPYSYIPFSAGPRNCIGQKFAMLEIKSITSKVLRNFKLIKANSQKELQLMPDLILKSANGIKIQFQKRQYK